MKLIGRTLARGMISGLLFRPAFCLCWLILRRPVLATATNYDWFREEARGMLHWPRERSMVVLGRGRSWYWRSETEDSGV